MKKLSVWLGEIRKRNDIVLAVIIMVAVFMVILPLPTILVDCLIAINLMMSIVLLMTALYQRDPLEFSTFPSLLLITTLIRLALSISTCRLILLQQDAGDIVFAFGNFVVGGNLAVGIIIFSIITIVQFMVITKGAERVAEVSARFSLDAMPGKQMSIDGDLRSNAIDSAEASRLRNIVQKESKLYGAMDGAMKFVKGDAIASILIVIVNIIGGIAIGMMQHGMDASSAASLYSLLSIGDGLVSQIPALIISIAAGIIVTRVPGAEKSNVAGELMQQLGKRPEALMIGASIMALFAIVPGFPMAVFLPMAVMVGGLAWYVKKSARSTGASGAQAESGDGTKTGSTQEMQIGTEPLSIVTSPALDSSIELAPVLETIRWRKFEELGLPLPIFPIRTDNRLSHQSVQIRLYEETIVTLDLASPLHLISTQEARSDAATLVEEMPFGGMRLLWVRADSVEGLRAVGIPCSRGADAVGYCASLTIDRFAGDFVGVQETRFLMDSMEKKYAELVKELQRQLPIAKVADVLQRLVTEGISIRDMRSIFEALIEWAPKEKDTVMLAEHVRVALRRQIIARYRDQTHTINALLLSDTVESTIRESIRQTAGGAFSTLNGHEVEEIVDAVTSQIERTNSQGTIILTAIDVRRFLKKFIERRLPATPVLSFQEIGDDAKMNILGSIEVEDALDMDYARRA